MPSLPQRARQTDYARPGGVLSSPLQWFFWLLHRSPGQKRQQAGAPNAAISSEATRLFLGRTTSSFASTREALSGLHFVDLPVDGLLKVVHDQKQEGAQCLRINGHGACDRATS